MFEELQKNNLISIHANRSCYDFHKVYFISQDDDSITVLNFVSNSEVIIPKKNIEEISVHGNFLSR